MVKYKIQKWRHNDTEYFIIIKKVFVRWSPILYYGTHAFGKMIFNTREDAEQYIAKLRYENAPHVLVEELEV